MNEHIQSGLQALRRGIGRTARWIKRHAIILTVSGMLLILALALFGYFAGWWTLGIVYLYISPTAPMFLGHPVMTYLILTLYTAVWLMLTFFMSMYVWATTKEEQWNVSFAS